MGIWPEFSESQMNELRGLGVVDGQLRELRKALLTVRSVILRRPANAEVREILGTTAKLSASLAKCLSGSPSRVNASITAASLIAQEYWCNPRVDHPGPTVAHHLVPLLEALADAAKVGIRALPIKPIRHKSADPRAVEEIANALVYGWPKAIAVEWTSLGEIRNPSARQLKIDPFPKKFRPNWSPSSAFAKIVGICFAAVGGNEDPERAIKGYMSMRRKRREAALATFEKGASLSDGTRKKS